MTQPLRVLVADDERPARRFLTALLKSCQDVELVGEAANGEEAVSLITALRPHLALLDLRGLDWRPRGETYSHLVMYEAAHAVDTVLVAGEVVLQGGHSTRLDEAALLAEVDELAAQDERDNAGGGDIARGERAVFEPLLREALARDLPAAQGGLDRFARLG